VLTLTVTIAVPILACSLFLDGFVHACAQSFSPAALVVIGPLMLSAAVFGVLGNVQPGTFKRATTRFYQFCTIPFDHCPETGRLQVQYHRATDPALFGMVTGALLLLASTPELTNPGAASWFAVAGAALGGGLGAATWRALSGWQTIEQTRLLAVRAGAAALALLALGYLAGYGLLLVPIAWATLLLAYGLLAPRIQAEGTQA
jgi:hypothetical protein